MVPRHPPASLTPVRRLSASPAVATAAAAAAAAAAARRPLQPLPPAAPPTPARRLPAVWFNASVPARADRRLAASPGGPLPDSKPPDERTLKLGKTLRILQERLPTLLQAPLPSEILAPTISLHLFPSTHPHLPVVSGRVAYMAALWTSPLAWNRVPLVGSVRLQILSERMSRQPLLHSTPRRAGAGDEQLVVRWRTVGGSSTLFRNVARAAKRATGAARAPSTPSSETASAAAAAAAAASPAAPPPAPVGTSQAVDDPNEFTGLFIFEFDGEGRVLSHTIEHVAEGGDWERSVGARFVGLTDWLLGGIKGGGSGSGETPLPAFEAQDPKKMR